MAGKGDKYRKVDKRKYDQNYDRIFKKDFCPKCGSEEIDKGHVGPEHYCGETDYLVCEICEHQWDHQ